MTNIRRVVITGMGITAPNGIGINNFKENLFSGKTFINKVSRFDTSKYSSHLAGEVRNYCPADHFPERFLKRIDRFSELTLVSCDQAIAMAKIIKKSIAPSRIGISIGNCIGGWEFAERELRHLCVDGVPSVSPYQATAWFPAAPQGLISLRYGIRGYSKTVTNDRCSGLLSLGFAVNAIRFNRADIMIAGGVEAPISPYGFLCCTTSGFVSKQMKNQKESYAPFGEERNGMILGEGSGVLILEEYEHAKKRNVEIYGEIVGFSSTADGQPNTSNSLYHKAIGNALNEASIKAGEVDYINLDASADFITDPIEASQLKKVFGDKISKIPTSVPQTMSGNCLGASGSMNTIASVLSMREKRVPPTVGTRKLYENCPLNLILEKAIDYEVKTALICSKGQGGINAALVLKSKI